MPLRIYKPANIKSPGLFLERAHFLIDTESTVPDGSISLNHFMYGRSCFRNHFQHMDGPNPGWAEPCPINWAQLLARLPGTVTSGSKLMLVVYHGMKDKRVIHGLRFVEEDAANHLSPELDTVDGDWPAFEILPNGSLSTVNARADWKGYQVDYADQMRVQRTGFDGEFIKFTVGWDPKALSFPWVAEIKLMFDTNVALAQTAETQCVLTNFASFHVDKRSKKFDGDDGFRHGVCFHVQKRDSATAPWVDMLTNDDNVVAYEYDGADIGHLCPPRCKTTK